MLHEVRTSLVPTIKQQRPVVMNKCKNALSQAWDARGLADEATLREVIALVQQGGGQLMIGVLVDSCLPGGALAIAIPL